MTPRLAGARYLREYKIHVTFDDGNEGIVDMEGELWGEVFEPLKDTDVFRCFHMDPELDTIVWPPAPTWRRNSSTSARRAAPPTRDHGAIDPVLQRGGRLGGKHV